MIVVIGNGSSRSVIKLEQLDNEITYGCNAIFRDYSPTHLVCGDGPMTWDICRSGYSVKNHCHFKMFDRLPGMQYDMLKMTIPSNMKILETKERTEEFVMFGDGGTTIIYWVHPEEKTENIEWWDENHFSTSYNSGTAALRLACLHHPGETIYCIGFDYYLDRTADNIYLGTSHYLGNLDAATSQFENLKDTDSDPEKWIKQHKRIEEEFTENKILHVGKHLNYIEFENLLNK